MSSLSFFLNVPKATSASNTPCPPSLFQAAPKQSHLAFPISIPKDRRLKATKTGTDELPFGLRRELMPNHVGIVVDGNRRTAEKHGLHVNSGYEAGVIGMIENLRLCSSLGIPVVTLFAFPPETWDRSQEDVNFLMKTLNKLLKVGLTVIQKEDIRLSIIGQTSGLPTPVLERIAEAEEVTKNNSGTHVIVPVNYSSKREILAACKSICQKVKEGVVKLEEVDENTVNQELGTKCIDKFPEPDLVIRTGGGYSLSDFYLWQSAYAELYFSPLYWPDFGENEFLEALAWFQQRERRYGKRD